MKSDILRTNHVDSHIKKYDEYVDLCKKRNETPYPINDKMWTTHKGKLVQNNSNKELYEQTATDDYLDYLDSQY